MYIFLGHPVYGDTEQFETEVGLHQGSALSPFLFVLVMDMLSEMIVNDDIWELLYADNLVVMAYLEEDLQLRILEWQESLETRGLRVNVSKIVGMVSSKRAEEQVSMEDRHKRQLNKEDSLNYLGSMVDSKGGMELDGQSGEK